MSSKAAALPKRRKCGKYTHALSGPAQSSAFEVLDRLRDR
jgi:hypothetical protein